MPRQPRHRLTAFCIALPAGRKIRIDRQHCEQLHVFQYRPTNVSTTRLESSGEEAVYVTEMRLVRGTISTLSPDGKDLRRGSPDDTDAFRNTSWLRASSTSEFNSSGVMASCASNWGDADAVTGGSARSRATRILACTGIAAAKRVLQEFPSAEFRRIGGRAFFCDGTQLQHGRGGSRAQNRLVLETIRANCGVVFRECGCILCFQFVEGDSCCLIFRISTWDLNSSQSPERECNV